MCSEWWTESTEESHRRLLSWSSSCSRPWCWAMAWLLAGATRTQHQHLCKTGSRQVWWMVWLLIQMTAHVSHLLNLLRTSEATLHICWWKNTPGTQAWAWPILRSSCQFLGRILKNRTLSPGTSVLYERKTNKKRRESHQCASWGHVHTSRDKPAPSSCWICDS